MAPHIQQWPQGASSLTSDGTNQMLYYFRKGCRLREFSEVWGISPVGFKGKGELMGSKRIKDKLIMTSRL